jgi:cytochrome c oxidase assembly protein Cox11
MKGKNDEVKGDKEEEEKMMMMMMMREKETKKLKKSCRRIITAETSNSCKPETAKLQYFAKVDCLCSVDFQPS